MKGPTMRRWAKGRTRPTSNPPRSLRRCSITISSMLLFSWVGRRAGSIVAARMPFHDGQYHLGQLGAGTALSNALDIDSCPFKDQKNLVRHRFRFDIACLAAKPGELRPLAGLVLLDNGAGRVVLLGNLDSCIRERAAAILRTRQILAEAA